MTVTLSTHTSLLTHVMKVDLTLHVQVTGTEMDIVQVMLGLEQRCAVPLLSHLVIILLANANWLLLRLSTTPAFSDLGLNIFLFHLLSVS